MEGGQRTVLESQFFHHVVPHKLRVKLRMLGLAASAFTALSHLPAYNVFVNIKLKIEGSLYEESKLWSYSFLSQMILTVFLSNNEQILTEVPITPETTCRDVVEFCKEPGEGGCHLAEVWRGSGMSGLCAQWETLLGLPVCDEIL